jgi:hypothetical protein
VQEPDVHTGRPGEATEPGGCVSAQQYEFRVSGRLSRRAREAISDTFAGLSVRHAPPETIIYGPVRDESHLHGVLALIQSLGLHVVLVHQVRCPHPHEPA